MSNFTCLSRENYFEIYKNRILQESKLSRYLIQDVLLILFEYLVEKHLPDGFKHDEDFKFHMPKNCNRGKCVQTNDVFISGILDRIIRLLPKSAILTQSIFQSCQIIILGSISAYHLSVTRANLQIQGKSSPVWVVYQDFNNTNSNTNSIPFTTHYGTIHTTDRFILIPMPFASKKFNFYDVNRISIKNLMRIMNVKITQLNCPKMESLSTLEMKIFGLYLFALGDRCQLENLPNCFFSGNYLKALSEHPDQPMPHLYFEY